MRFLRELSTFARRHPETHVVVVVEGSQSSALKSDLYMYEIVTQDLLDELLSRATGG